jgi:hypothetical protein
MGMFLLHFVAEQIFLSLHGIEGERSVSVQKFTAFIFALHNSFHAAFLAISQQGQARRLLLRMNQQVFISSEARAT